MTAKKLAIWQIYLPSGIISCRESDPKCTISCQNAKKKAQELKSWAYLYGVDNGTRTHDKCH
nr:MAG TPA: hypothetical protein [Caudoviricetes sp.]